MTPLFSFFSVNGFFDSSVIKGFRYLLNLWLFFGAIVVIGLIYRCARCYRRHDFENARPRLEISSPLPWRRFDASGRPLDFGLAGGQGTKRKRVCCIYSLFTGSPYMSRPVQMRDLSSSTSASVHAPSVGYAGMQICFS